MLSQHLATMGDGVTWDALITLAERDPFEPLPRAIRARVARRLLETAGFVVGGVVGPIGEADPAALLGRRR